MSIEDERYIIDNYHKEKTKDILNILNITRRELNICIEKFNIKKKSSKKYNFNEDYFEVIDSEDKSYWLGFFYADGYVRTRKTHFESRLKLGIKDLNHLEKFKENINGDNNILIKDNTAILSLNTKKFTNNLIDKGCHQAKTFTITFPYFLDECLYRHFIRGYFDGDGSISESQRRKCNGDVDLVNKNNILNFVSGSDNMLNSLAEIISEKSQTKSRKIYKYKDNNFGYIIWWTINDIKSIYHYFYDESTIYMDRKKEKFEKILKINKN